MVYMKLHHNCVGCKVYFYCKLDLSLNVNINCEYVVIFPFLSVEGSSSISDSTFLLICGESENIPYILLICLTETLIILGNNSCIISGMWG